MTHYIGRFAPSPTGPLHKGSLVAAMASYLDARAHHGRWLLRIEDIDEARTIPGSAETILETFERLAAHVYPCGCTRREIADSRLGVASDGAAVYPGTCRQGLAPGKAARAYRLRMPDAEGGLVAFEDRWMEHITQHLASEVGDFVLKRADGFWAYQLAVVVDDAEQGITHVVRGSDLLDSTPRQIYLQRLLDLPTPRYLHVPVVVNAKGEKLSKQTGALALDLTKPLEELLAAAAFLGLTIGKANSIDEFWQRAITAWKDRFPT
jgi:glutamyl-Q tRNA(Asp) synthetase